MMAFTVLMYSLYDHVQFVMPSSKRLPWILLVRHYWVAHSFVILLYHPGKTFSRCRLLVNSIPVTSLKCKPLALIMAFSLLCVRLDILYVDLEGHI